MGDNDTETDKNYYYSKLEEFYADKKNTQKKPWTSKRCEEVLQMLIEAKAAAQESKRRTRGQYYFGTHYDILEIGGLKKVIKKRSTDSDPITFIVPFEEFYTKLKECHISTGHGGRDKMKAALKPTYSIPRTAIEFFVKHCPRCSKKRGLFQKSPRIKTVCSMDWNHRGQVDLINFQSTPDGEFKWLMNYQDHLTKFVHLRPLKTRGAVEVAHELLKIFLQFGAPKIVHCDNAREFVSQILKNLLSKWPDCKIINGDPKYPNSPGGFEISNQDVQNKLRAWLQENKTQNWSLGCYFVQWQINSSFHSAIGRSPYKALFGVDVRVGLYSTNLPKELVETITTEENLEIILEENSVDNTIEMQNVSVAEPKTIGEVQIDEIRPLREAVAKTSNLRRHSFKKCQCKPKENQCSTNRCLCFKILGKCHSGCHSGRSCSNK